MHILQYCLNMRNTRQLFGCHFQKLLTEMHLERVATISQVVVHTVQRRTHQSHHQKSLFLFSLFSVTLTHICKLMFCSSEVKYYVYHKFRFSPMFCHVNFSIHYYIISSFSSTLNEHYDLLNICSLVFIGKEIVFQCSYILRLKVLELFLKSTAKIKELF